MLYVSSLLKTRYPEIVTSFRDHVDVTDIFSTKDIWIRDFMPIRNAEGDWVLFRYFPKYLENPKFKKLRSENVHVCDNLGLEFIYCSLVLDGGSVVYNDDIYFISERVFKDNSELSNCQIFDKLRTVLCSDNLVFLLEAPNDFTGHLDGILSILDRKTVLVNEFNDRYGECVIILWRQHKLSIELPPYNVENNNTYQSGKGIYVDYVETENYLFVPIFNQPEDDSALSKLSTLFSNKDIVPINCRGLAKEGGLLHCVTWEDWSVVSSLK